MPASNARAMEKAMTLAADAIIVDLEDSVAPDSKKAARQAALQALRDNDYGYRKRVLRVNGPDTDWFLDDIAVAGEARPDAILVPKVESASMIEHVQQQLDKLDPNSGVQIWAMMETPKAVVNATEIAACSEQCTRLSTFCIGNNDLAREADMKVTSDRTLLMPWLLQLLLIAKAFKLSILDGVYNDFADLQGFAAECTQGAAMGMTGKTLIHPKQIDIANAAFAPSEEEVANAQRIVDTFALAENLNAGVVQINGRMIERLHLDMARNTLDVANRIKNIR